jgi:two-component system torCAD operon response regulator TorR
VQGAKRIILVETDAANRALLTAYLLRDGYAIAHADGIASMERAMAAEPADVVVLDGDITGGTAVEVATRLRAASDVGIILMSSRTSSAERLLALEVGADEVLGKPPNPRELLARANNLVWRIRGGRTRPTAQTSRRFSGWTLNLPLRRLHGPLGEEIYLTRGEFDILALLVERGGRVATRDQLVKVVSGPTGAPGERTIDVLVSRLRRKLGDDARSGAIIVTVHGIGYRLGVDVV